MQVDPANFDAVMSVNARGIFLGCRAVLPHMLKVDYGRIINIASVAGKEGNAGMGPYSASKGAVIALTKVVGKEYAETKITCNAVAPAGPCAGVRPGCRACCERGPRSFAHLRARSRSHGHGGCHAR